MKVLAINLGLLLTYAVTAFCWLTLDPHMPWVTGTNALRLVSTMIGIVILTAFMRIRRPDSDSSILQFGGLWIPFYIP
jgi:hypothetical protein